MKYPRIPHIKSSNPNDDDIVRSHPLTSGFWIVTEKVDGSQISFQSDNGVIRAFNRGTELLLGHSDRQFDTLVKWVEQRYESLLNLTNERYILFGEWLYHKHTVNYKKLPDWFIGFGIYDIVDAKFVPFYEARIRIQKAGLQFVPVIYDGYISSESDIHKFISTSNFSDCDMEGVVLHSSSDDMKYKYVTREFKNNMDHTSHWRKMIRTKNGVVKKW